jgi:ubiquinone/menaquinone biosynthesis C-methylase UbiE
MQRSSRVDYDALAELYDSTPHREKSADPELIAFLPACAPAASLTLLDIACGTGNQQIANRDLAPDARFVGLDGSLGMLRQARRKMPGIAWVHGDSAALPFASGSFDFVSCQYAFHHFRDKAGMLHEAFRVLRRGGRFALYNMCPPGVDQPDLLVVGHRGRPYMLASPIRVKSVSTPSATKACAKTSETRLSLMVLPSFRKRPAAATKRKPATKSCRR